MEWIENRRQLYRTQFQNEWANYEKRDEREERTMWCETPIDGEWQWIRIIIKLYQLFNVVYDDTNLYAICIWKDMTSVVRVRISDNVCFLLFRFFSFSRSFFNYWVESQLLTFRLIFNFLNHYYIRKMKIVVEKVKKRQWHTWISRLQNNWYQMLSTGSYGIIVTDIKTCVAQKEISIMIYMIVVDVLQRTCLNC